MDVFLAQLRPHPQPQVLFATQYDISSYASGEVEAIMFEAPAGTTQRSEQPPT